MLEIPPFFKYSERFSVNSLVLANIIVGPFNCFIKLSKNASLSILSGTSWTTKYKSGRSKLALKTLHFIFNCFCMSTTTFLVAVAVKPSIGGFFRCSIISASFK